MLVKEFNEFAQRNCFAANLSCLMDCSGYSSASLFWALIDIDERKYEKYKLDWVTCYLSSLGVYDESLWVEYQVDNAEFLCDIFSQNDEEIHLAVTGIENVQYRCDIGGHIFPDVQHAFLIRSGKYVSIEDHALGCAENVFSNARLKDEHFKFPFVLYVFDKLSFLNRIAAINLQDKVQQYAENLYERRNSTVVMKSELLESVFQGVSEKEFSFCNLYEESFYYRRIFLKEKLKNLELAKHQKAYGELLSHLKTLYYRSKLSRSSDDRKKIIVRAREKIIELGKLEHEFYEVFRRDI